MTPEQQAKAKVNKQFVHSDWIVQDFKELNPLVSLGITTLNQALQLYLFI